MSSQREYTCAECGKTFTTAWSDEEANAEAAKNFPTMPIEEMAVVCDDCYRAIMRQRN